MDNVGQSSILNYIKNNPDIVQQLQTARKGQTFNIEGKTYGADELNKILQQSLSGENSSGLKGLTVERSTAGSKEFVRDEENNIITYPKEGETFEQTAERLGFRKGTTEYDEFVSKNKVAQKRHWFRVGEKIIIPADLEEKVVKDEVISEEDSQKEVGKWQKRVKKPEKKDIIKPPKPTSVHKPQKPHPVQEQPKKYKLDNYYGNSAQKRQGDCYLMATINAIRNKHGGQKILQNLRSEKTVNGKKVYTFNFPGAKLAAESLKKDNLKGGVFITGTYSFTEDEIKKIMGNEGSRYSTGDPDTILLEAAFEKYRKEVEKTLKANHISLKKYFSIAGMVSGRNKNNILEGGWGHDAAFVLTGKVSEVYMPESTNDTPVLSSNLLHSNIAAEVPIIGVKSVSEIDGPIKREKVQLNRMLDKVQRDYEKDNKSDIICTASFLVGSASKKGGHEFTVKRVTKDKVILINPWYPSKELVMSRDQFLRCSIGMTIVKDKPSTFWDRVKEHPFLERFFD